MQDAGASALVAIPSIRVSVFRPQEDIEALVAQAPGLVAIPSVRVSVFRLLARVRKNQSLRTFFTVAIPSVRVSVFRPLMTYKGKLRCGCRSQSPRFGSRCFVDAITRFPAAVKIKNVVAIPSVRVSVFRRERRVPEVQSREASQSPRFGSRCFVYVRTETEAPVFTLRGGSQSPRFGSRCFVVDSRAVPIPSARTLDVAIPSVRVSVFRPNRGDCDLAIGHSSPPSRNPLGSGLGVSSDRIRISRQRYYQLLVAIPSVRVSVFRHVNSTASSSNGV